MHVGLLNYECGNALRALGADEEALPYFRAARENPLGLDISSSYFGLADLIDHLGQDEEAWKLYQELLALPEANTESLAGAVRFALRHGRKLDEIHMPSTDAQQQEVWADALNSVAWNLATSTDERFRNGAQAVQLATAACNLTGGKNPGILDSLAAAHAEAGQFAEAVSWQQKALELAPEEKKADYQSRLGLYQKGEAYRETQKGQGSETDDNPNRL